MKFSIYIITSTIFLATACSVSNYTFHESERNISGKLIDSHSGKAIIGANVFEFGNENNQIQSDLNGEFTLRFTNNVKFIEIKGMHLDQVVEISNTNFNVVPVQFGQQKKADRLRMKIRRKLKHLK